jgi:NAD(P)-dependent dehydrogenase (short-subunit alcohol dehydrogenase family)
VPFVLVTGANRGIGLEFVRQYAADGWRVFATCRNPEAAAELAAISGEVSVHRLDVCDFEAVAALGRELRDQPIDILVSNAGVMGPSGLQFGEVEAAAWMEVLKTNVIAPLKVAEAFVESVARSDQKKIAFLSSQMGSIADNTSGAAYIYRSSKAALNAVGKSVANDLAPRGIVSVLFHPGWVKTDMGGPNALISVEESVSGLRKILAELTLEDNGRFLNYRREEVPW